ncbi:MAG: transposase [Armatimonadota bacterium]
MDKERHFIRKQMRLEDVSYSDPAMVYFATLCANNKEKVFLNKTIAKLAVDSLMWCHKHNWFRIYAYCLMPNHLHLALSPVDDKRSLSESIGKFKSYTTSESWKLGFEGQLWQRSWYDHIARRDEDVLAICRYILENPVRATLVESCDKWPYSGMIDPLPL